MINRRKFLQVMKASTLSSMLLLNSCWNPFANKQNLSEEILDFQENGILRLTFIDAPSTFDPALADSLSEHNVNTLVYNSLIWLNADLEPQPDLAEFWEYLEGGIEWIFKLRENVMFHHDVPLTSVDVVYTFKRILDAQIGSPLRTILDLVGSIEEIDDYTVRFVLKTPNLDFPLLLAAPQAKIISKVYEPEFLAQRPSGTGPFKFSTYTQGELLVLEHYPNYWDLASSTYPLKNIEYHYIASQEQQVRALLNNEVDVIPGASFAQTDFLIDQPDIIVKEVSSGTHSTIVMRATEPPFDNPLVRKALKLCVDRPALLDILLNGRGEIGNDHPVPSSSPYWNDLPQHSYDPRLARELLTEAGYPDGFTLDLITSEASAGMVRLAKQFSEMAAPAGVNIIVTEVSPDIYWSEYWNTHVPFFMSNWSFRPSLDEMFMAAYHSSTIWNDARWHTPELDELIDNARSELDHDKRVELYQEAQRIIHEDGAVIIPYFRPILIAMNRRVHGLEPYSTGLLNLRDVRLLADEDM